MNFHSTAVFIAGFALLMAASGEEHQQPQLPKTKSPNVVILPVSGTVDAAMAAFIGRALKESEKYRDRIIVLELDTYGGEVDAAFRIVDTMLSLKECPTVAYVKTKAISAGTLIALSCQRLYMRPNTTLGDVAPLMVSQEGPKMLGEKFQSPIRAKFRVLAKKNGYPERLTEALVTMGSAVFEVKFPDSVTYLDSIGMASISAVQKKSIIATRTVVKAGELLTMDDIEAKALSFSRQSVESVDEMLKVMGYESPVIKRYERNWSEELVRILAIIAPILMTIGIGLLYIEFKTPGLILPGVLGAICLAVVFFGQYMVGLANYTDVLLAAFGVMLIGADIFIFTTGGLVAIPGGILLVIALVMSLQGFAIPKPDFPWQKGILLANLLKVVASAVGAGVLSFSFIKWGLPRLSTVVRGPYLNEALTDVTASSGLTIAANPGDKGVVVTALRPAGRATINGEMFDVVSNGDFIEKGKRIMVTQVQGTRIVVVPDRTAGV
jgi:membrane-bound serine protease (ClpP class)